MGTQGGRAFFWGGVVLQHTSWPQRHWGLKMSIFSGNLPASTGAGTQKQTNPPGSVKIPHSASPSLSLLPTWPKPGEGCGDGGFCICQKQPRSCSFPLGFTEKYCDPHLRFIKVVKRRDFLKPKGPLHAVQPVSTFSQPNRKNSRQDK